MMDKKIAKKEIFVTRPSMPPLDKFVEYLQDIWDSKWVTNIGKYHKALEEALCGYLGVKYCSLFCNGTLALQTGLQALGIEGEVITTPFTFPATVHAIFWNKCTPVFCDIDEKTYNIDPSKLEKLITPRTKAIIPVHIYGNPCDMESIKKIAEKYGLKILYDAAHAFGVKRGGKTILDGGHLTMLSFHATKIFNTIEGGALVTNDPEMKKKIDFLKNFGFSNETSIVAPGTNAKMNELQAAYGLLQLDTIDECMRKCKDIYELYAAKLKDTPGIICPVLEDNIEHNYSYFPVRIVEKDIGVSRDALYERLKGYNIFSRRYFYPLISNLPFYSKYESSSQDKLPVANRLSMQVLCLPVYPDLGLDEAERVCEKIFEITNNTGG